MAASLQIHRLAFAAIAMLLAPLQWNASAWCQESPRPEARCPSLADASFEEELWAKVALPHCLTCHRKGGDGEKSRFVLIDPRKTAPAARAGAMNANRATFVQMAALKENGQSTMLLKAKGELDHGGAEILPADSAGYRILAESLKRLNSATTEKTVPPGDQGNAKAAPFFSGVVMLDDRKLLRRLTLSLCGRLPENAEKAAIAREGLNAMPTILDGLMKEDAFYERLRESFNDLFLTLGIDGNADQTVLSYEHFEKTRHWYQTFDLSQIKDKDARQRAEWKIAAEYRKAILGEPMKLVEHIVRHGRPFTEILTADYILVSPYSARGYGIFEEVKGKFKNSDDPFEYVPVKLKALVGRSKSENQESTTGFYPHAGILGMFQYLTRYPTTETNRNRLRARMFYQHFLGVDVLELAERVSDAAAVTARYKVPTMQAAECVVCHKTLDPVAGLFQDYWRFADQGVYGKRKEGWFRDMFAAGFEGEDLPEKERWRALQWLGERAAKDPRFAVAMTEHAYYLLTGRKTLLAPKDWADPLYPAKARAHAEQRREVEAIAARFLASGFDFKELIKAWALSEFYRADALTTIAKDPCRQAELDDVGLMRLLSPEQLERKVKAVFGERWGRLEEQLALLYGGIDSKEVTDRATDPGGAMGAIQRALSNDVACKQVARDFALPAAKRRLFPEIEPKVVPGASAEADLAIRKAIVHLHERILGRLDAIDSVEVSKTFDLLNLIVKDAREQKSLEKREAYHCRPHHRDAPDTASDDPHYTLRAWRAVVTYLLRRSEFLYE